MSGKRLTDAEVARFRNDGVVFPVRAISEAEAACLLAQLEGLEAERAGRLPPLLNAKPHLLLPWLWELVHDSRIVDAVEDVLGPDILCFGTSFISKLPGDGRHVTWHQDATHWGLSSPEAVTAWLALTPSTVANGCVRMVPGTHTRQLPHDHPDDPTNMLGRRERLVHDVNESDVVDVVLSPGEMSLHHPLVVHGSAKNNGTMRRTGFAIRYIPAHVRQTAGRRNYAALVRGRDFGHFERERAPSAAFEAAARAHHRDVFRQGMGIIFDGAGDDKY